MKLSSFYFCVVLFSLSCGRKPRIDYVVIPSPYVYNIKEHNDSVYFSTLSNGIFRMSPAHPESTFFVAKNRSIPIRTIIFTSDGLLLASSYSAGIQRCVNDSLVRVPKMFRYAWSMALDDHDSIWTVWDNGVYKQQNDSLVRFSPVNDARDIAVTKDQCAVAGLRGITILDRLTGAVARELYKGIIFWSIKAYDSVFIAGGMNKGVIINKDSATEFHFGPDGNIAWSVVKDSTGTIYLGTQKGLYCRRPGEQEADCVAMSGECVKSLMIDKKGELWVGQFAVARNLSKTR